MKKHTIISMLFLIGLFCCVNIVSQAAIKKKREDLQFKFASPGFHLSADFAKMISGEFKGLFADYLLMEVGSYIGSNQDIEPADVENIASALELSLELDPYFQQTYIYSQGNLPWFDNMVDKTNSLLAISAEHRPWDWRPMYYIGFNHYYFQADFEKAADMFLEASKIENAPVLLAVLGSRFAHRSNRTETAIALLAPMLDNPELTGNNRKEIENRITALKGIMLLEKAIGSYSEKFNRLPDSLEKLVEQGLVPEIPGNPYAQDYVYDLETGKVFFDKLR